MLLLALVSLVGVPYTRADAGLRYTDLPWRTAHARLPDDGVGLRRAARRALARARAVGRRPGTRDSDRRRAVRRRAHRVRADRANLWLALPCLIVAGFGFMVQMASSNTVIQTIVDDEKRGRVMSFYMMAFLGTAPFGSLIAGSLSSRIGAPNTLMLGGVCCVIGAAVVRPRACPMLRAHVRPIYIKLGIIPEVSSGLATAAELSVPPERN